MVFKHLHLRCPLRLVINDKRIYPGFSFVPFQHIYLRTVNVIKVRNLQFIFLLNKLHQRICQIMYKINQIMYETKDKNYGLRSLDLFIASATFLENVSRK